MKFLLVSTLLAAVLAVAQTFTNPVLWEDLSDLEVIRVGDTYYYTASTMHFSPGAPVLRSYDLVHWEFIGHSVPELTFGAKYYLNGSGTAYVNGIWASSLKYRQSNGLFYWYGCVDFAKTYIFTAKDPAGEWTAHPPINDCYYDVGVLVDDNDIMYAAYGSYNISVVQLSSDGLKPVRKQVVWSDPQLYLEGSRFYHINNNYYIWLTKPADGQQVLKASSPWGPYTKRTVLDRMASPIPHSGTPHQGAIVDTPGGDWYYMSFLDAYPNGRMPALAPLKWGADGWPSIVTDSAGGWGKTYPMPASSGKTVNPAGEFTDSFTASKLGPEWEWNHNPDNAAWTSGSGGGLTLRTATVTQQLYSARNTLTHRILGPESSGTFRLNVANMADGDVAGVAIFRDQSAYIGLQKAGGTVKVVAVQGIVASQSSGWKQTSNGNVVATASESAAVLQGLARGTQDIWLRVTADVTPTFGVAASNRAQLSYSTDGTNFKNLGPAYQLQNSWQYFMAYRFAVFNYATKALGGSVLVKEFSMRRA